jgi:hypothetical protein
VSVGAARYYEPTGGNVTDHALIEQVKALIPDLRAQVAACRAALKVAKDRLALAERAARCPQADEIRELVGEKAKP